MALGHTIVNPRRLSYSLSVGTFITGLSYALMNQSGEMLVQPGVYTQVMLNGLLLFIPSGDYYISLPRGAHLVLNLLFYSATSFAGLFVLSLIRDKHQDR